jgi:hypothetical protein
MMRYIITLTITFCAASCGCSPGEETKSKDTGKPETQKLKAADAVGYDGDALRKSVDTMLDKNDQQKQDLEDAQKAAGQADDKKE